MTITPTYLQQKKADWSIYPSQLHCSTSNSLSLNCLWVGSICAGFPGLMPRGLYNRSELILLICKWINLAFMSHLLLFLKWRLFCILTVFPALDLFVVACILARIGLFFDEGCRCFEFSLLGGELVSIFVAGNSFWKNWGVGLLVVFIQKYGV